MSDPNYLGGFFLKAQMPGSGVTPRTVVVNDFVRADMARAAGVLQRNVGGVDPNIPAVMVLSSSVEDEATRPRCVAMALNPKAYFAAGKIPEEIDYRLYIGDTEGGFPKTGVRIHHVKGKTTVTYEYGDTDLPEAEKEMIRQQIDHRLHALHISITPAAEGTPSIAPKTEEEFKTESRQKLSREFLRPVEEVLTGPQKDSIHAVCEKRCLITEGKPRKCESWDDFVSLIENPIVRQGFIDALHSLKRTGELYPTWLSRVQDSLAKGGKVTYNDLPFGLALELQAHLQSNPWEQ